MASPADLTDGATASLPATATDAVDGAEAALPSIATEPARREALAAYNILDTLPEAAFDGLTALASEVCDAPVSLVSLLDGERQWYKSRHGTSVAQTPIATSFCAHAVATPDRLLVIEDMAADPRFRENPLVIGPPHIGAYAGAPLVTSDGVPLGTLCVIDMKAREFTPLQLHALEVLRDQVVSQLELRWRVANLEVANRRLRAVNEQLDQFAYVLAHDLRAPLRHQVSFARVILEDHEGALPADAVRDLQHIVDSGARGHEIIDELTSYLHGVQSAYGPAERFSLQGIVAELSELIGVPDHITLEGPGEGEDFVGSRRATRYIIAGLLANAIKHHDKNPGRVCVNINTVEGESVIEIVDDGPGLPIRERERIFNPHYLSGAGASAGSGSGIGVNLARRLARSLGGDLEYEDAPGGGSLFRVRLPRLAEFEV